MTADPVDPLEAALFNALTRLDAGESLTDERLEALYAERWEEVRENLEIHALLAAERPAPAACDVRLRSVPADRYGEFRLIGQGGMGVVYRALDTDLGREIAMKIVRPRPGEAPSGPLDAAPPSSGSDASAAFGAKKARFLEEVRVTAALDHPGVVPVHEVGETPEGVPYYTMRFVRGNRTLAHAIDEARGRPVEERLRLLDPYLKVCDTMRYAHAHGVVHRDLKPDNVALGEFGEAVVLDWGLAKRAGRGDAAVRGNADARVFGTPGYMSPEAAAGRVADVDERSDVYALGAILYRILTGRLPYEGRTVGEALAGWDAGPPPEPAALDAAVPRALSAICMSALSLERDGRPRSVGELAAAIRTSIEESLRDREVDELARDASAGFAAAADLEGEALLRQLDRVHAAANRVLAVRAGDARATELIAAVEARRETGVRQRENAARRRTWRRAAMVGLAAALIVAATFAFVVDASQKRSRALALTAVSTATQKMEPKLSVLLAREAVRSDPSPLAMNQLRRALAGNYERTLFDEPGDAIVDAAFGAGENQVITVSRGRIVRVRPWRGGSSRRIDLGAGPGDDVHISPRGDRILVVTKAGLARVHDLTGSPPVTLGVPGDPVRLARWSPDGDRILFVSAGGGASVCDAGGRDCATPRHVEGEIADAVFAPGDERVLLIAKSGAAFLWDLASGSLATVPCKGVDSACFSHDGARMVTTSNVAPANLWRVSDGAIERIRELGEAADRWRRAVFAPKNEAVFTGSQFGKVYRWDLTDSKGDKECVSAHGGAVTWTVVSSAKGCLVTACSVGVTRVWTLDGTELMPLRGHEEEILTVAVSASGARVLTTSADGTARGWDLANSEVELLAGATLSPPASAPPGVSVRIEGDTHQILVLAGADGRELPLRHENTVNAYAFSSDGARLATVAQDKIARVWDVRTGDLVWHSRHECPLVLVAFSPDGHRIAAATADGTILVWNFAAGGEPQVLPPIKPSLVRIAFSPSGDRLLAADRDGAVHAWRLDSADLLDYADGCLSLDLTEREIDRYRDLLAR